MSDADTPPIQNSDVRYPVDATAFRAAFAERGCARDIDQAVLLGTSRRAVYRILHGEVIPLLSTARRYAKILGRDVDDLWPAA